MFRGTVLAKCKDHQELPVGEGAAVQGVVGRDTVKGNGQQHVGSAALPLVEAEAVVTTDADDAWHGEHGDRRHFALERI